MAANQQNIGDILSMIFSPGYGLLRGAQTGVNALRGPQPQQQNGSNPSDVNNTEIPGGAGNLLTYNKLTPNQQQASQSTLNSALQGLGQNKSDFGPIAQQARNNFSQQGIPSILERFSGLGAQKSSAFGQTLGQAESGLESNLAALGSQHGLKQQELLQQLLRIGLQPQIESLYSPRNKDFGEQALEGLASNIGPILMQLLPYLASL